MIMKYRGYGYDVYKMNGEEVDQETYRREYTKKTEEDAEFDRWTAKKERIQLFGLVIYGFNLLDTWYVLRTGKDESDRMMTFTSDRDYTGINWCIRF